MAEQNPTGQDAAGQRTFLNELAQECAARKRNATAAHPEAGATNATTESTTNAVATEPATDSTTTESATNAAAPEPGADTAATDAITDTDAPKPTTGTAAPEPTTGTAAADAARATQTDDTAQTDTITATADTTATADAAALWRKALSVHLEIAPPARLGNNELRALAAACDKPSQLELVLRLLAAHAARSAQAADGDTAGDNHRTAGSGSSRGPDSTASPACGATHHTNNNGASAFGILAEAVDDSNHDLREWVNALELFNNWLTENRRSEQPLHMLLGYLFCAAEAQRNSAMPLPLPHILADMLEIYGYDGDIEISSEP